jgi:hypothetical protein
MLRPSPDESDREMEGDIERERDIERECLTPEQAEATLDYFVSSGDRLSQMTKTYHNVEAVTR